MDKQLYNYSDGTFSPDSPIVWSSDVWEEKKCSTFLSVL